MPCEVRCDSALGYFAEQRAAPPEVTRRTAAFLASLANAPVSGQVVAWVHNPGLARNLLVTREWARQAGQPRWRVVFHHHDWWFDNRWARWPDLREAGISSPDEVADALFTDAPDLRHAAINGADAAELQRSFAGRAALLPNPVDDAPPATTARVRAARRWLADQAGIRGPMWLLPCRLLRRKNVAEALLVMRALAPDAVLATTGAVSSRDEEPYATALREEARRQGWPLRLSVLAGASGRAPEVRDLMGAASVVPSCRSGRWWIFAPLSVAAVARPPGCTATSRAIIGCSPCGTPGPRTKSGESRPTS